MLSSAEAGSEATVDTTRVSFCPGIFIFWSMTREIGNSMLTESGPSVGLFTSDKQSSWLLEVT